MGDGTLKEIENKRTLYSKTYDSGKEYLETEISSYPIHYQDENDKFKEIDTNITTCQKWEFQYGVTSNLYNAYFGDINSENKHLVSIEFSQKERDSWTNFKLIGSKPSDFTIENNKFTFVDCFENVDVEYIVESSKLKENIVLKKYTALREFKFSLKNGNVQWKLNEEKELEILKNDTLEVIWKLDKPFMYDSENNVSYNVEYKVENDTLIVTFEDEEFLKNAVYPVYVDPTTTLTYLNVGIEDAYRDDGSTGKWITDKDFVRIGKYAHGINVAADVVSVIKFNFNYNDYGEIVYSKLNLNMLGYSQIDVNIYNIDQDWNLSVPTASYDSSLFVSGSLPKSGEGIVDVTSLVQYQIQNKKVYGFRIMRTNGALPTNDFASSRNSNTEIRPKLIIRSIKKPVLGFHDGTNTKDMYYTDGVSEVFKYMDFGTLIAGTTSTTKQMYIRNLSDFAIKNLQISPMNKTISNEVTIQISENQAPFISVDKIVKSDVISPNQDISFFVRITTSENANGGGIGRLLANAYPQT